MTVERRETVLRLLAKAARLTERLGSERVLLVVWSPARGALAVGNVEDAPEHVRREMAERLAAMVR